MTSAWVRRFVPLMAPGKVLDLACGRGRHSRLLAAAGYSVLAVDRDAEVLQQLAAPLITPWQCDLENSAEPCRSQVFVPNRFTGIVVTNYLHRPLFPLIAASLAPGGVLIYETFALGNARFGKPSNPDFLLRPAELLDIAQAQQLEVVAFEQGYVDSPKPAITQRLCAIKPASGSNFIQD